MKHIISFAEISDKCILRHSDFGVYLIYITCIVFQTSVLFFPEPLISMWVYVAVDVAVWRHDEGNGWVEKGKWRTEEGDGWESEGQYL